MVHETNSRTNHDGLRYGENLAVHHELLIRSQLHEDDPKVGSSEVKREELSVFFPVWKFSNKSGETFNRGGLVALFSEALLDRISHLLF